MSALRLTVPPAPPSIEALQRLPGYWRCRALGRALASASPDLSRDRLADEQAIALYERRAEEAAKG